MKVLVTVFLFSVLLSSCSPGIKEKHPTGPDVTQDEAQTMSATKFYSRLENHLDAMDGEAAAIGKIAISYDIGGVRITAYGRMMIHGDGARSWMITSGRYEGKGIAAFFSGYSLAKEGSFLLVSGKTGSDDSIVNTIKALVTEHVAGMDAGKTMDGYLLKNLGDDGYSGIAVLGLPPDYPYFNLSHVHYLEDGGTIYSLNADEDYSWTGGMTSSYSFFVSSANGLLKKIEKAAGDGYDGIGTRLLSFPGYQDYRSSGMDRLKELFVSNFGNTADLKKTRITHHHKELGTDEYGFFTSLAPTDGYGVFLDAYVLEDEGCFYVVDVRKKDSGYSAYGAAGYEIGGRKHIETYNDDGIFKKENLGLESFRKNGILGEGQTYEAECRPEYGSFIACWNGNLFMSAHTPDGEKGFLYADKFLLGYARDGNLLIQDIPEEAKPVLMDMLGI